MDVGWYVEGYVTCLQVNLNHQKPHEKIPLVVDSKEKIIQDYYMEFKTKLHRTTNNYNSIWFVVDRLTEFSQFIPICESYSTKKLVDLYIKKVVRCYGTLICIIYDRDNLFTSRFWRSFQEEKIGSKILMSIAITRRRIDKVKEQSNHWKIGLMCVSACVIDFVSSCDD